MKENFIPAFNFPFLTKSFDVFLALTIPEKKIKENLIDLLNIKEGDKILDLGCGTGTLLILGKHKHPQAHFIGIDIDPKVLAIAKRKIAKKKIDISLLEYDGGNLPQHDNSIDKVMTSLMMHHLDRDKKLKALQEIVRILVPRGTLHIADFENKKNPVLVSLNESDRKNEQDIGISFKGLIPELMTLAGFINVKTVKTFTTRWGKICIYSGEKA
jgi:ubiquinone/menaquinone biosynthesis C-methylase UbiE